MIRSYVLKTVVAFVFVGTITLFTSNVVRAEDLSLVCNESDCVLSPSAGAALFGEFEDLNWDVKPGDNIKRRITMTNNGLENCFLTISSSTITSEVPSTFSQRWWAVIKDADGDIVGNSSGEKAGPGTTLKDILTSGLVSLGGVLPGETKIFDWIITFDPATGNEYQRARIEFDFDMAFTCGERPKETELFIQKTNNRIGQVISPGDNVLYTLRISASDFAPVYNVFVFDLPPGGFYYTAGSWTAVSSTRGNIKGVITTEPTYSSPGTWFLGDMVAGEEVLLTYLADTDENIISGVYPDIAWTTGTQSTDPGSTRVIGNLASSYFVGTDVEISVPVDFEEKTKVATTKKEVAGAVLGVSTSLPATGANPFFLLVVFALFGFGIILLGFGVLVEGRIKNSGEVFDGSTVPSKIAVNSLLVLFCLAVSLCLQSPVLAATSNITVAIHKPESPTNIDTMDVNFVALDILDRNLVAKCFILEPGEISFRKLGSDIALKKGGDTDYCRAGSAVFGSNGTYKFYVTVESDGELVTSQTVTVAKDGTNPGKPKYIEKERVDSCTYDVSFRTAFDNGDTSRVELYRSDSKAFVVGPATRIQDISVGSDQKISLTLARPTCGKTYYFAVRAFDLSGNASSIRVEEVVEEVIVEGEGSSQSSAFGEIVAAAPVGTDASFVNDLVGEDDQEGLDAEVQESGLDSTSGSNTEFETGDILGEATTTLFGVLQSNPLWAGVVVLIVLVIFGALVYVSVKKFR